MAKKSKFSISLDLDNTLVCSTEDMNSFEKLQLYSNSHNAMLRSRVYQVSMVDVVSTIGSGVKTSMWGIYRPHLKTFLNFCNEYFTHCFVYSAGLPKYVDAICEILPSSDNFQPSIIYNRTHCITTPEGEVNKPLTKFYENYYLDPIVTPKTLLHLDDLEETFSLNVLNGIQIPAYSPSFTREGILASDDSLLKLMAWLSLPEVMECNDVRQLDKSKIFSTSLDEYYRLLNKPNLNDEINIEMPKVHIDSWRSLAFQPIKVS